MINGPKRSRKRPIRRLDRKAIRYIIRQRGRKSAITVASEMKITRDWVYKLWRHHARTGQMPEPKAIGRPKTTPSKKEIWNILDQHAKKPAGVIHITKTLRLKKHQISYYKVYDIMQNEGLVIHSKAKSKRRKYVRYERRYSNAMWQCRLACHEGSVPKRGQFGSLS